MKSFKQFLKESKVSQFEIAYKIAKQAHSSQRDWSGAPYLGHINRVIKSVRNHSDEIKAAAHEIYNELRSGSDLSDAEIKKKINQSKHLFNIGNR